MCLVSENNHRYIISCSFMVLQAIEYKWCKLTNQIRYYLLKYKLVITQTPDLRNNHCKLLKLKPEVSFSTNAGQTLFKWIIFVVNEIMLK